jgi:hypothetical protein
MSELGPELDVHIREYEKCKIEQMARISFRDNLVYVTLAAYGAIVSFAAKENHFALLVLPWASIVFGWGYLVNDEKVSAIGRYIRIDLTDRIAGLIPGKKPDDLFRWEIVHRSDPRRRRRKYEQFSIDLITFVLSGFAALAAFWIIDPDPRCSLKVVVVVEGILLLVLGIEFFIYADFKSGR